jgi:hypothetical protein
VSSIDEASGAVGGNAEQARELATSIMASKETIDSLAGALTSLGVETKASEANAASQAAETLTGQANGLADALDALRSQIESLRGLLASSGAAGGEPYLTSPKSPAPQPQSDSATVPDLPLFEVTKPSLPPDLSRKPGRGPTPIPPRAKLSKQLDIQSENDAAAVLARSGYRIEQNPPPKLILSLGRGRACDLRVCDMDGAVDAGHRAAGSLSTFFFLACRNSAVIRSPAFDRVDPEVRPVPQVVSGLKAVPETSSNRRYRDSGRQASAAQGWDCDRGRFLFAIKRLDR